jgi:hypothetical protein
MGQAVLPAGAGPFVGGSATVVECDAVAAGCPVADPTNAERAVV